MPHEVFDFLKRVRKLLILKNKKLIVMHDLKFTSNYYSVNVSKRMDLQQDNKCSNFGKYNNLQIIFQIVQHHDNNIFKQQ